MGLSNDRYKVKRAFLAVSKETPPDKKRFIEVALEDDSQNIRPGEKKLQDKILRIDLEGGIDRKPSQIHRVAHFDRLGFVFFE